MLTLTAILLFCGFTKEVADSDFWWHLRTGQYIVQTHHFPVPDPFSFTTAAAGSAYPGEELVRRFNLTHEWLFQVAVYAVFSSFGFAGIVTFRALILMVLCAAAGLIVYRRTGGFYRAVIATVASASVAWAYQSDRPFVISFALLAIVMAILESRRFLWALPLLFIVWANLHGGYFLGWTALGAYSLAAIIARWRGSPEPGDRAVWIFSLLSIAASGLNPNFFQALPVLQLYRQSFLQQRVFEWQRTALWPIYPFQAVLFGSFGVLIWARRRVRLVDWLLYAAFAGAALLAVRNMMFIGIIGPIVAMSYIPWKRQLPKFAPWVAGGLLIAGILVYATQWDALQFRASEWKYPWGAAKFVEDHHIGGRMLNTYVDGGFLLWRLWPLQQTFIDGRALSDGVYKDYIQIVNNIGDSPGRNAGELIQRYGIDVALLEGFEYVTGSPLLVAIAMSDPSQSDWKLVYQDSTAALFMKHPPPDVQPIKLPYALAGLESECENFVAHQPDEPRCARGLGFAFLHINDFAHARRWFAYYLERIAIDDPEARQQYQQLLSKRKR